MPQFNVGMCHQISDREIVIFGGKDTDNNQTREAVFFDTSSNQILNRKSLKSPSERSALRDYRLPLEVEIPTTPFQVANNLFCIGWSKNTGGIHLLKMSLTTLTWK